MSDDIYRSVSEYYSNKIAKHGAVPQGVDWNSTESQTIRFEQLLKILPKEVANSTSLLDWGCGYGALLDCLGPNASKLNYIGVDISPDMIAAAKSAHVANPHAQFHHSISDTTYRADYLIASGLFSVKLNCDDDAWLSYVKNSLIDFQTMAGEGFSFNCLTKYSDQNLMRSDLYYADPMEIFDFCKTNISRNVALLHDYDLYEFTVLVRKG